MIVCEKNIRTRLWRAAIGLSACALISTGCHFSLKQDPRSLADRLSKNSVQINVPYVPQGKPYLCGVASAKMISKFYGLDLTEAQWGVLSNEAKAADGVSGASLKFQFEAAGYFAAVFQGALEGEGAGILHQIDLGRPVMVMLGDTKRHFCIVAGYDRANESIILMDPDRGEVMIAQKSFMDRWNAANRFSLLVVPKQADGAKP